MNLSQPDAADKPTRALALTVPITVAKWWRSRRRNESIHVTLSTYEGRNLISVRIYETGSDGIDRPSVRGVSMALERLPELTKALLSAELKARELGLIGDAEKAAE